MGTKPAASYAEYKAQCCSLRLFAFPLCALVCSLGLILDPPKSSYWCTYGPSYWWRSAKLGLGGGGKQPVFLNSKQEFETRPEDIAEAVALHSRKCFAA